MPIYHIWIFLCLSTFKLLMKSLHFKKCMFKSSPNIPNQNYSKKPNPPSLISQNPCWKINSRQKYSISKKMSKSIFALLQTQIYLIGRSKIVRFSFWPKPILIGKNLPIHLSKAPFLKSSIQEAEVRVPIRNGDQGSPEPTKKRRKALYVYVYALYLIF